MQEIPIAIVVDIEPHQGQRATISWRDTEIDRHETRWPAGMELQGAGRIRERQVIPSIQVEVHKTQALAEEVRVGHDAGIRIGQRPLATGRQAEQNQSGDNRPTTARQ